MILQDSVSFLVLTFCFLGECTMITNPRIDAQLVTARLSTQRVLKIGILAHVRSAAIGYCYGDCGAPIFQNNANTSDFEGQF